MNLARRAMRGRSLHNVSYLLVVMGCAAGVTACSDLKPDQSLSRAVGPDVTDSGSDAGESGENTDAGESGGDASDGSSGDATDEDICANSCSSEGTFQCDTSGAVDVCTLQKGCLAWRVVGNCPSGHLCCDGLCTTIDSSNCYACNKRCDNDQPVCSAQTKTCSCTGVSCAAAGKLCNAQTGQCEVPTGIDLYVNAAAQSPGDGTLQHPFTTITEALTVAAGTTKDQRISVAPGRYDAALGEKFPLQIPGGVSLEGAGEGKTVINGAGRRDEATAKGQFNGFLYATVLMGSAQRVTSLSGCTLQPGDGITGGYYYGVFCDSGNYTAVATVTPTTVLRQVTIGPGYDTGVVATSSTIPVSSGCNLKLVSSTITGNHTGLSAYGCDRPYAFGEHTVGVQIGDQTASGGNAFTRMLVPDEDGYGVSLGGCVAQASIWYNSFATSNGGIYVEQPTNGRSALTDIVINHNTFDQMTVFGVYARGGAAVIRELNDNSFTAISRFTHPNTLFPGLALIIGGMDEQTFVRITKARRNSFVGNDGAVVLLSYYALPSSFQPPDFGTAADHGANTFLCNSGDPSTTGIAGDVRVLLSTSQTETIPFVGNAWDHAPPLFGYDSARVNGQDIAVQDTQPITVDASAPTLAVGVCPTDRVR
jgi:hypothetical protein